MPPSRRRIARISLQVDGLEPRELLSAAPVVTAETRLLAPAAAGQPPASHLQKISLATPLAGTVKAVPFTGDLHIQNTIINANGGTPVIGAITVFAEQVTTTGITVSSRFLVVEPGTLTINTPAGTLTSNIYSGTGTLHGSGQSFTADISGLITSGTGQFPHTNPPPKRVRGQPPPSAPHQRFIRFPPPIGFFVMQVQGNTATGTLTGELKLNVFISKP